MTYTIRITNSNESFGCTPSESLLGAMETLGRKGIPVGCRGGGCGVCKVRIDAGNVHCETMSRACVSVGEEGRGLVLACRTRPRSDLTVTALDRLARCLQRNPSRRPPAAFLARAGLACSPNDPAEGDLSCR